MRPRLRRRGEAARRRGARRVRAADAGGAAARGRRRIATSAVAQDVVVRMRARVGTTSSAVLVQRSLPRRAPCGVPGRCSWRPASRCSPAAPRRRRSAARARAVRRGPRARAATRCSARSTGCAPLAAAARKAQVARDEAAAAHDDAEQACETRRRGDLVARSQKAQGEEAQRQVRASTNASAASTSRTLRRGTVGLRSPPPSRAAKSCRDGGARKVEAVALLPARPS